MFRNNMQVQSLRMALRRLDWGPDNVATHNRDAFVVVLGAGTTGIEVAGELAALRGRNPRMRVVLVDGKSDLLPGFSPFSKRLLKREFKRLQIESVLGSPAVRVTEHEVQIENGQIIPWNLLILCTGSRVNNRFMDPFGVAASPLGLRVKKDFQIEGFRDHYAIGDIAHAPLGGSKTTRILPKLAQFAVQEGRYVARLLSDQIQSGFAYGKGSEPFGVKDWGYLVSLGPTSGIGRLGPEFKSPLVRAFSPFVVGPVVDQLKQAARLRYLSELKLKSLI
jgi:NADH dehydrogenase